VDVEPLVAEEVASLDLMLALVAAGYALALVGSSQIIACRNADVIGRPLAGRSPMLTTYLLRRDVEPSETLSRFIDRVSPIITDAPLHTPESTKEINS
jgi:DNA-binding transcriptional LysR family regulator